VTLFPGCYLASGLGWRCRWCFYIWFAVFSLVGKCFLWCGCYCVFMFVVDKLISCCVVLYCAFDALVYCVLLVLRVGWLVMACLL